MTSASSLRRRLVRHVGLPVFFGFVVIVASATKLSGPVGTRSGLFQSPPPMRPTEQQRCDPAKPELVWVQSDSPRSVEFGACKISFSRGFTDQSGACVHCQVLVDSLYVGKDASRRFLPGTEIALGIWAGDGQTQFQEPIEIRIKLDTTKVALATKGRLVMMMFSPATGKWKDLVSDFDNVASEFRATVQSFEPLPKGVTAWDKRTLFGVFERGPIPKPTATRTPPSAPTVAPTATHTPPSTLAVAPTATDTPTSIRTESMTPSLASAWTPTPLTGEASAVASPSRLASTSTRMPLAELATASLTSSPTQMPTATEAPREGKRSLCPSAIVLAVLVSLPAMQRSRVKRGQSSPPIRWGS